MGAKVAGIHFFTPDPDKLPPKLEKEFSKQPGPSTRDRAMLELLRAMAEKDIRETISDEGERAAKRALVDAAMSKALREAGEERAVLVLRPAALSLYWYDHIRTENMEEEAKEYAKSLGVPALGLGVYDDTNAVICATDGKKSCHGLYWFDEEDIEPVDPEAFCALLGAADKVPAVAEALRYQDAETMVQALEQIFGVELYLDPEDCRGRHYGDVASWPGADVFRAG